MHDSDHLQVQLQRSQFPALQRTHQGSPAVYLDGPAGTQVPQSVIDAVVRAMTDCNANLGGVFPTSRECTQLMAEAGTAFADFVGATDPQEIIFGANATTLTFSLSRALARTWRPGDEIIVTDLDHDSNVTPWVLAARDQGITVHTIPIRRHDCTLDLEALQQLIHDRTRLLAIGSASNGVGTRNPIATLARAIHDVGGLVYVDAVHAAPHVLTDVQSLQCDFLVCSAYKFFGPHVGVLWGRRAWLDANEAYKVRPAPLHPPGKWMTGTQNHPCVAGAMAAVNYLADLGRQRAGHSSPSSTSPAAAPQPLARRDALRQAFDWIESYERRLMRRLLDGLAQQPGYTLWGITEAGRDTERLPTLGLRHQTASPRTLAQYLADQGIFAWHGNFYALRLSESLGAEPDGMVRLGLIHYNTTDEVDRTLDALQTFHARHI